MTAVANILRLGGGAWKTKIELGSKALSNGGLDIDFSFVPDQIYGYAKTSSTLFVLTNSNFYASGSRVSSYAVEWKTDKSIHVDFSGWSFSVNYVAIKE